MNGHRVLRALLSVLEHLTGSLRFWTRAMPTIRIWSSVAALMAGSLLWATSCIPQAGPTETAPSGQAATATSLPTTSDLDFPTLPVLPSPSRSAEIPGLPVTPTPTDKPPGLSTVDVEIEAPSGPIQIAHDQTTSFTLTIRNHGPDPATGILLTDMLPRGLVPVWTQPAPPRCRRQDRTLICDLGELRHGDAVSALLDLSSEGTDAFTSDPSLSGVTWELSASTCSVSQVSARFEVACHIPRLQPESEVQIRIGLEAESWLVGSHHHTVNVAANESDLDPSNNRATFSMEISEGGPATVTSVPTTTDLLLQAEGPQTVTAGQPFNYTFTIVNHGKQDATGVRFELPVPPDANLIAFSPALPACEQQGDTITCYLKEPVSGSVVTFSLSITGHEGQPVIMEPEALVPGWPACSLLKERAYLHILECALGRLRPGETIQVDAALAAIGVQERKMDISASVSANEVELVPLDNVIAATLAIQTRADLSLETASLGPVSTEGTLSYIITVTNLGPSDADDVGLSDSLPAGTSLISAESSLGGECLPEGYDPSTNTVRCNLGRLSSGERRTVSILIAVDDSSVLEAPEGLIHIARVMADQTDPDTGNNELTESLLARVWSED